MSFPIYYKGFVIQVRQRAPATARYELIFVCASDAKSRREEMPSLR
jgi:hypothetical protein